MPLVNLETITPDPAALRALSHPVRLRILGLLRRDGASTASELATRLGLNSGATSYHLRQLAVHGFVVDDPSRGNGRDRWWRAAHQSTRTDPSSEETPEGRDATDAFSQAVAVVLTEQLQRAIEERPLLPPAWRRASSLSDWRIRLSPARAEQLVAAVETLVEQWQEDPDGAEGVEDFYLVLQSYPMPGRVPQDPA